MSNIKAVLFDLDGVLIDACEIHREAFRVAIRSVGLKDNYRDSDLEGRPTKTKCHLLGISDPVMLARINEKKQELTMRACLLYPEDPARCEILERLSDDGLLLGCVTNSIKITAEGFLASSGLYFYLDCLVHNECVMMPKPDPQCYRLAMEHFNLHPKECLILEDSPIGLEAARRSGGHVMETTFNTMSYASIRNSIDAIGAAN